jgi:hypothetical protein
VQKTKASSLSFDAKTESDDDLEDQLWKLGQMSLISAVLGELFVEQCVC